MLRLSVETTVTGERAYLCYSFQPREKSESIFTYTNIYCVYAKEIE